MKRTALRPFSAKRRQQQAIRRRLAAQMRREGPVMCEMCGGRADDLHERLSRARGGSITDPANLVALCRPCHMRVTTEPLWAQANGWAL